SLKTSIKTITYLSDIGCLEIQGASLQTDSEMSKEWTINRGLYASFRYEGEWEHYPEWARNLYLMELPARRLARMNGSDIERFYYNEDFVEKDSNDVVCEIFIPVRPV
uniref:GyrI-like domain-containing protein n=1 Tax=Escherichia coli TaxID=562 RepID=UPI0021579E1E